MLANNLEKINALRETLNSFLPLPDNITQKLDKKFRLEFHYNTNHLEGNTLTYSETELLLIFDETRGNHTGREYDEMRASDAALLLIEQQVKDRGRPLTEMFIRQLNQVLLVRPYWKDAITNNEQETRRLISIGEYKHQPNSVKLSNGEVFEYASPQETPILMRDLIDWFHDELAASRLHPVQLASQLHYKFVRIHPFDDGNGRISRLLMNYVLLYFDFPPIIIKSDDKKNYLSALRDADTGNVESFENYIASQLLWSLEVYIKAAKGEPIEESEDWKKKLQLLKVELNSNDQIQKIKNETTVEELIVNTIIPFMIKMKNEIVGSFQDLFLQSNTFFKSSSDSNNSFNTIEQSVGKYIQYKDKYQDNMIFNFIFEEFSKNGINTFNINAITFFIFQKYSYIVSIGDKEMVSKYYHLPLTDADYHMILSKLAEDLLTDIENNISKLKV